jgi:hypothetical protein
MSQLVQPTANALCIELLGAIAEAEAFLALDRSLRADHAWMKRCLLQRHVGRYLSSAPVLKSRTAAIQLATIAATAYLQCVDGAADTFSYPTAAEAKIIKGRADGLAEAIGDCRWLPIEAKTPEFQRGLEVLCKVYPVKREAGENKKGDPRRRSFIARLAADFYRSFRFIPVAAITELTAFGWPDVSERAIRLVLTAERQREIVVQVQSERDAQDRGNSLAIATISRLTRRGILDYGQVPGAVSPQEATDDAHIIRLICGELSKNISDPDFAHAAVNALRAVADDFGFDVNRPSSPTKAGSEIDNI